MIASIVIPTFHRHDLLMRALAAVCRQEFSLGAYEVIVADDAASDATRHFVESFSTKCSCCLRYVAVDRRHGPAAARNRGWRAACGEVVAFTDDDCIPSADWLTHGVAALQQNQSLSAVWGKLVMPIPTPPTDYQRDAAGLAKAVFVTANCFVRRQVLEQLGGFDEQFTVAWREDTDLYFRLLKDNHQVAQVPSAIVVHPVRPASWGVSLFQQAKSRFDVLLYRKHPHEYSKFVAPFPVHYWFLVAFGCAAIVFAGLGQWDWCLLMFTLWLAGTLRFTFMRLSGTSHRSSHVMEMLVTSILIPWLAVYNRLIGWWIFTNHISSDIAESHGMRGTDAD